MRKKENYSYYRGHIKTLTDSPSSVQANKNLSSEHGVSSALSGSLDQSKKVHSGLKFYKRTCSVEA
jgi:hypothetical protein